MIYLSGKITNSDPTIQQANLDVFNKCAKEMRDRGLEVFNPAELETEGWAWEEYLARDVKWIMENRPTLFMMKGWEDSLGARLEFRLANLLNLDITYE